MFETSINTEVYRRTSSDTFWKVRSLIAYALRCFGIAWCSWGPVSLSKRELQRSHICPRQFSGRQRLDGATVAAQLKRRALGTERNGSGDRCTMDVPKPPHTKVTAVRSTEWVGDFSRLESTTCRWWA
jgi:hypothetical protein